jgi:hypothetical protein
VVISKYLLQKLLVCSVFLGFFGAQVKSMEQEHPSGTEKETKEEWVVIAPEKAKESLPSAEKVDEEELKYWKSLSNLELDKKFKDLAITPRRAIGVEANYFYINANPKQEVKPAVLIVIHGTGIAGMGGPTNPDYFDFRLPTFRSVLKFARQYAEAKGIPGMDVIVFRWGGGLTDADRKKAAQFLAQLLSSVHDVTVITLSHSHGSNVLNYASQLSHTSIPLMIQLGTPVREKTDPIYKPTQFNKLISFWSPVDWIAKAGCLQAMGSPTKLCQLLDSFARTGEISFNKYETEPGQTVKNIEVEFDGTFSDWREWLGQSLGHSFIQHLITHLFDILTQLDRHYPLHNDLIIDVPVATQGLPILAIQGTQEKPTMNNNLEHLMHSPVWEEVSRTVFDTQQKKESEYSQVQKALFRKKYGTDMDTGKK